MSASYRGAITILANWKHIYDWTNWVKVPMQPSIKDTQSKLIIQRELLLIVSFNFTVC